MPHKDLDALMDRVAKGDEQAFRRLAHALGRRMHALARRLLSGDEAAAEDAVQEALTKLWIYAPRWKSGGSVAAYASRIVHTTCMDIHRKSRLDQSLPESLATPSTILSRLWHKQQADSVSLALDKLPARQKQALLLFYFEDMSQRDVARAMGISEKAAESLIIRARSRMAQILPETMRPDSRVPDSLTEVSS